MGSCLSRPKRKRPRITVLLPAQPSRANTTALQERIALNEATLRIALQKIGHHPTPRRLEEPRGQTVPYPPPPSATPRRDREVPCRRFHHDEVCSRPLAAAHRASGQAHRNKPLPPLPREAGGGHRRMHEDGHPRQSQQSQPQPPPAWWPRGPPANTRPRPGAGSRSQRVPSIILRRIERDLGHSADSSDSESTRAQAGSWSEWSQGLLDSPARP